MNIRYFILFTLAICLSFGCKENNETNEENAITSESREHDNFIYVGTYTRKEGHVDGKADGVYRVKYDKNTGALSETNTVADITNPSFVASNQANTLLFTTSELAQTNERTGFVESFAVQSDGSLKAMSKLSTEGRAPCHVTLDKKEKLLFVANYADGVVKTYKVSADGSLTDSGKTLLEGSSVHPRQEAPHAHSVKVSNDNKMAFVPDLGSDKVWIFVIDHENGKLVPHAQPAIEMAPGSGPRHMDITPDGKYMYIVNELNSSVSMVSWNQSESLYEIRQTLNTLPSDYSDNNSCADIHVHPNGKFVYASNRGHNSIVAFSIKDDGSLDAIGHYSSKGEIPRNFNISPDGNFLLVANQNSDNIVTYQVDTNTGSLSDTGLNYEIMTPVCIDF